MKLRKLHIVFGIIGMCLSFMPSTIEAATQIGGTINTNTTLGPNGTPADNVYWVTSNLNITEGATLTIEQGVVIKFNQGLGLGIQNGANLVALGSDLAQIRFTSIKDDNFGGDTNGDGDATTASKGDWVGIYVHSSDPACGLDFEHVTINYATTGIQASDVPHSYKQQIITLSNVDVSYCLGFPLIVPATAVKGAIALTNSYSNNGNNAIGISGSFLTEDATWTNRMPFVNMATYGGGSIGIVNAKLTLEPGVIMKSKQGGIGINDGGHLSALGTAQSKIVFTSFQDDNFGGDTNGDGNATSASLGDWSRIYVFSGGEPPPPQPSSADFDHVIIHYAQNGIVTPDVYVVTAQPIVTLSNSEISNCSEFPVVIPMNTVDNAIDMTNIYSNNRIEAIGISASVLTEDAIWTNRMPYINMAGVWAGNNVHANLILEAGVIYKSKLHYLCINNGGHLSAEGTAELPIIFTSNKDDDFGGDTNLDGNETNPVEGDWAGICLYHEGPPGSADFDHIKIRYAKNGIWTQDTNYLDKQTTVMLSNSDVSYCSEFPVVIPMNAVDNAIDLSNTYFNNGIEAIGISASYLTENATWTNRMPYVNMAGIWAGNNVHADLVLEPGVIYKSKSHYLCINNGGYMHALGTAEEPIIFTSNNDENFGGDTNGAENATLPNAGDWKGVHLYNEGAAGHLEVDHVMIRYAQTGIWTFDNIGEQMTVSMSNTTVSNCSDYPVRIPMNTVVQAIDMSNTYTDNNKQAIAISQSELTENATWTNRMPYVNTRNYWGGLAVSADLVLAPGLIFKSKKYGIVSNHGGFLHALGTSGSPIVFTSLYDDEFGGDTNGDGNATLPNAGDWGGIYLFHEGPPGRAEFDNVKIRYANYGIWTQGAYTVENQTIVSLSNSDISDCLEFPVMIPMNTVDDAIDLSNTYSNNGIDAIGITASYLTEDATWTNRMTYVNCAAIWAGNSVFANLVLEAGVIIKSKKYGISIQNQGSLIAAGECRPSDQIIFTSFKDDSFGGDTNNDGEETVPASGDWSGIELHNDASLTLENGTIRFAQTGIKVHSSTQVSVTSSNLIDNTEGIINHNSTPIVYATNNCWGHETGPYHPTSNPGGLGNSVTDNVDFSDWAVEPVCMIENSPPTANIVDPDPVDEGGTIEVTGYGDDPDEDPLTYAWDLDNDGIFETPGQTVPFSAVELDGPSAHTIRLQVTDDGGLSAIDEATVQVDNVAPTTVAISAPIDPVLVNTEISVSADFTDPGIFDTHTTEWDWGDESTLPGTVEETNGSGTVTGMHSYDSAGVYTITLTVTDKDGASSVAYYQYVVVYDPSAGFVTGAGWINSPEDAYPANPSLTGKAIFGFVSKYHKGASTPSGNTRFKFKVADLSFKSTLYDWMVIAGARAKYKGTGTINDDGNYGFMLSAIDGEINGGGGDDKFRIKIWDKDNNDVVVYDNQLDAADDTDPTTILGAGSIKIHKDASLDKPFGPMVLESEPVPKEFSLSQNYPNPFNPTTTIRFGLPEASQVQLIIYNTLGQKIRQIVDEQCSEGVYSVYWDGLDEFGNAMSAGVYFYQIQTEGFVTTKKMILAK